MGSGDGVIFDQTAERAAVESRMLDTCRITRDPEGVQDDILDPVTLELVPPGTTYTPTTPYDPRAVYSAEDESIVYEGKCSIAAYGGVGNENRTEGDRENTRQLWRAHVPITVAPLYGDTLEVLGVHAGGDGSLLERRFTVVRIGAHTLGVRRPLVLQDEKAVTVQ